jgi:hypothetical protein
MTAPWLPNGFHTITPNIIAEDAERAVDFLKRAFGATEGSYFARRFLARDRTTPNLRRAPRGGVRNSPLD